MKLQAQQGRRAAAAWAVLALLGGCAVSPERVKVPIHPSVELQRFMGPGT
ncbi:MAG: hypothetical protein U1F11_12195 [Steroidobacteraceae bacterium]